MFAEDALELLRHLKWDEVHLVGLSMGSVLIINYFIVLKFAWE